MATVAMSDQETTPLIERQSLCLSGTVPGIAIHAGEADFADRLDQHFVRSENNAAEELVRFKANLRNLDAESFWNRLMEGMANLCRSQFAFVSKRILVDDHDSAVEMPLLGEVGSCMMGVALYWNDGKSPKNFTRDYKYYAWAAPCSYMRHDKVFLCPSGISTLTPDNPNQLPFECEAYLGIPLFADGKCFAHFGLMWTKEGLELKKDMSWNYVEMLLHSLEDLITEKLLSGKGFAKVNAESKLPRTATPESTKRVIPQDAITAAQSLKPYARSLSHELRTPMQGVVGMLDIMHATVQEQLEASSSSQIRKIFQTLRDNIETVQDSSKRAVEAADNVVHAYDLNMQVPDTPSHDAESPANAASGYFDSRPKMSEGSIVNPYKRRRSSATAWNFGNSTKIRHIEPSMNKEVPSSPRSPLSQSEVALPSTPPTSHSVITPVNELLPFDFSKPALMTPTDTEVNLTPGARQSNIRELLPIVIHDSLRVGGRPDSAIAEPTDLGERIEVRTRSSNGYASQQIVEWSVQADVPDTVSVDDRDASKLISAVFLNAVKFTENGKIKLEVKLNSTRRFVLVNISDTGSGIPRDFQPELFKPFAKEDHSITRSKEGLGLGLLVAKGLARRTGGDLVLVHSSTEEPQRGTEFEIRLPIDASDRISRSNTPFPPTPELGANRSTPSNKFSRSKPSSPFPPRSPTTSHFQPNIPNINKLISAAAADEQRPSMRRRTSSVAGLTKRAGTTDQIIDKQLSEKYPLRFLVAEDNKINRKLLVNMLSKLGYKEVHEAFDGREAVRVVKDLLNKYRTGTRRDSKGVEVPVIDVILMDLWMPEMDGYEATERILGTYHDAKGSFGTPPMVLAVSADVTEAAVDRATRTGMQGYMTKPYKLMDLQRLIIEFCSTRRH